MIPTFTVSTDQYTISGTVGSLPLAFDEMLEHATLQDDLGVKDSDGTSLVVSVARASEWPFLIVAQRFEPGPVSGFFPGALLVRETDVLFLGAGTRLLAYELRGPQRLWEEAADVGFWGWSRHEDTVLMSAELELAAWDIHGRKRWTTCVEPPWRYEAQGDRVYLDVMGTRSDFPLETGPGPDGQG